VVERVLNGGVVGAAGALEAAAHPASLEAPTSRAGTRTKKE
jgi:hypothetical protein